jgi:hypothetical protein
VIRILHLEESRIARICYDELSKTADVDPKRYNWVTSVRDFLNLQNGKIYGSPNQIDRICSKNEILEYLTSELRKDDTKRAVESERFNYLIHLDSGQRIVDHMNIGIKKVRILAQQRLNQTQFYWNNATYELQCEEDCSFCNLSETEDLFRFLVQ